MSKVSISNYRNIAWRVGITDQIVSLLKEGVGIRGISRYLSVSTPTVIKRIKTYTSGLEPPSNLPAQSAFEMDELRTYVGRKDHECWVMYALDRSTSQIVDIMVGRRTKSDLSMVTSKIMNLNPDVIYTDGLNS